MEEPLAKSEPSVAYDARHLVYCLVSYQRMCPDVDWSALSHPDLPPYTVRVERIHILMRALDLTCPIAAIVSGEFLEARGDEAHARALQAFERVHPELIWPPGFYDETHHLYTFVHRALEQKGKGHDLAEAFRHLYRLRRTLHEIETFEDAYLFCGYPAMWAAHYTASCVIDHTKQSVGMVEALLAAFVDPQGRVFNERELVERYDWPSGDIRFIDAEFY